MYCLHMAKFNIPKREYFDGDKKKMVSWRLPELLMKELDSLAKEKGWTTTELITTALDQYVQWEKRVKKIR
jgi:metal-responsive CopG/Arc/MetJ family transcriptional regulator